MQRIQVSEYMSERRFKFFKKVWSKQFQLEIDDDEKEQNKWWEVGYLVHGFNRNRQVTIASYRVKTLDESMSAFKPRTTKTGKWVHHAESTASRNRIENCVFKGKMDQ